MKITDQMIAKAMEVAFHQISNEEYVRIHLRIAFEAVFTDISGPKTLGQMAYEMRHPSLIWENMSESYKRAWEDWASYRLLTGFAMEP